MKKWVRAAARIGLATLAAASHAQQRTAAAVLRRIDDPGARGSWLLTRNPVHPAGPGRLIWMPDDASPPSKLDSRPVAAPVIRAGERLVVEERTPVADAWLEATALEPAQAGAVLRVRLEMGGGVVRAIALGPGRAQFATATGARP